MQIQQKHDPRPEVVEFIAAGREYSLYCGIQDSDSKHFHPMVQCHIEGREGDVQVVVWDAAQEAFATDDFLWDIDQRPSNFDLNILSHAWKEFSSNGAPLR